MKRVRRAVWVFTATIAASVIVLAMFVTAVPLSSDTLRHRIVETLSARLNSDVEIGALQLRVFPRLRIEGSGLTIRKHGRTDVPPLISIKSFYADADLIGLMRKHVAHVKLEGLDIEISPSDKHHEHHDDHEQVKGSVHSVATSGPDNRAEAKGLRAEQSDKARTDPEAFEDGVVIDVLDAPGAKLVIIPRKKEKQPKVWDIHTLQMHHVGVGRAMPFDATLTNGVPPGEIETTGSFGPWVTDSEGDTPLNGDFRFKKADLSVFKGISGILSSKGTFGGSLAWIDVKGETDTPDFTIKVGGHPFALHTKYHSVVDGTNGDTLLERIDANFLSSSLVAKGAVLDGPKGEHGRTVTLDIDMPRARIEDIMVMAVKAAKPPMTGGLTLATKFLLPPGETDVSQRLRLDGRFTIASARFTNINIEEKINDLSRRSQGKPEQVGDRALSNFQGRFKLAGGSLALPDLTWIVPGAKVQIAGRYDLKPETLDFRGTMLMDAKISQTMTGFKSILLKVVDPLFKKDGGGSSIPFKIEGTRNDPKFGLDIRRVFKKGDKS